MSISGIYWFDDSLKGLLVERWLGQVILGLTMFSSFKQSQKINESDTLAKIKKPIAFLTVIMFLGLKFRPDTHKRNQCSFSNWEEINIHILLDHLNSGA